MAADTLLFPGPKFFYSIHKYKRARVVCGHRFERNTAVSLNLSVQRLTTNGSLIAKLEKSKIPVLELEFNLG